MPVFSLIKTTIAQSLCGKYTPKKSPVTNATGLFLIHYSHTADNFCGSIYQGLNHDKLSTQKLN